VVGHTVIAPPRFRVIFLMGIEVVATEAKPISPSALDQATSLRDSVPPMRQWSDFILGTLSGATAKPPVIHNRAAENLPRYHRRT